MWIIVLLVLWLIFFVVFVPKESFGRYGYNDMFLATTGFPGSNITLSERSKIEEIIISKANEFNISPTLLVRIAKCESGLKPEAKNSRSTASGIFQFLTSTFINYAEAYGLPTTDKNDPYIQAELAARMIADGGLGHWSTSRSCWE